jgi:hypothetical protein
VKEPNWTEDYVKVEGKRKLGRDLPRDVNCRQPEVEESAQEE